MATIPPPPGELIDVRGYRLHLQRQGSRTPPVVLEAALGKCSLSWAWPSSAAGRIVHDRPQLRPGGPDRNAPAALQPMLATSHTADELRQMPLFVPPDLPPDVTTTYQALIAADRSVEGFVPRRWR